MTISTPGNYCLAMDMTATVSITAPNVCLDLNCRELTGRIIITAEDVTVKDGTVTTPAPTNNTDAEQAAIEISTAGTRAQLHNVAVECLNLADTSADIDGINGRSAIDNAADAVQISNCQILAGNGQGITRILNSPGSEIILNKNTGMGGTGISNAGAGLQISASTITAGSSGSITATAMAKSLLIMQKLLKSLA